MGGGFALIEVGLASFQKIALMNAMDSSIFHQIRPRVIFDKFDDDYMIFAHTPAPFIHAQSCQISGGLQRQISGLMYERGVDV